MTMIAILGLVLMVVGGIVSLVGGIWILVLAFQEHILWGLGSFFVPGVGLVFVIMHWGKAGKPFLINLGGVVVMIIGMLLGIALLGEQASTTFSTVGDRLEMPR